MPCDRTGATAKLSEIKPEPYTPEAVEALLQSFEGSAGQALLFLKSVRSISMHIKRGAGSPVELLHKVGVDTKVGFHPHLAMDACTEIQASACIESFGSGRCKVPASWYVTAAVGMNCDKES